MKKLSDAVKEIIQEDTILHFHMVTIGPFKNLSGQPETWRYCVVPGGTTVGGVYYTDEHNLVHVDAPRQTAAVDRETFKLSFSDPNFDMRALFENGFSGVPVEIRLGFYNPFPTLLGGVKVNGVYPDGVPQGEALTDIRDTVVVYAGNSDTPTYVAELDGDVLATLECTSPMGAIGMIRSLLTSKEVLRAKYGEDSAFDELYVGSKGLDLLWGKV